MKMRKTTPKKPAKPRTRATVPQANDLDLVADVAHAVASGDVKTTDDLAGYLNYVPRLGHYYAEAAEEIGIVERGDDGVLRLTRLGQRFVDSDAAGQAALLSYGIQHLRVIRGACRPSCRDITVRDIDRAIARLGYSGETISRRRSTLVSWLRWLAAHNLFVACHEDRRGTPPSFTILARAS